MRRSFNSLVLLGLVAGIAPSVHAETASTQNATLSASGTITDADVDSFSPSLTIKDSAGKTTTFSIDRYITTVSGQDGSAKELGDLKAGQEVQITARNQSRVGRVLAKSITITKEPAQAATISKPVATPKASTSSAPAARMLKSGK